MFLKYLKSKWKTITLLLVVIVTYSLVAYLHGMPINGCIYACCLCGFFIAVTMLYSYYRHILKVRTLKDAKLRMQHDRPALPKVSNTVEIQYQDMIEMLENRMSEIISQSDGNKSDMIDYYTMWVHQIKTPIAAMGLLLQTSDFEGKSEMQMELFKIEQYVEMVLQYLRLGSEQTDFVFRKQPLDPIIKECVRKYSTTFIKKRISLEYEGVDITVLSDEKWLAFVIEQVLSNALKYTNKGEIAIYMSDEIPNTLVIQDTGIGIQAEDLPRVFDRGYTGYNGRNDKKSTGIGLYLCNSILQKMGHAMSIESTVGVGTKVKLDLNRREMSFE